MKETPQLENLFKTKWEPIMTAPEVEESGDDREMASGDTLAPAMQRQGRSQKFLASGSDAFDAGVHHTYEQY